MKRRSLCGRRIKDSTFSYIFNEEKYVVDLYKALTGIMLDPSSITSVRLADTLKESPLYNDVSFITKNHDLIVLIEHQSTPNPNIPLRLVEYCVHLLSKLIKKTKQNKFGSKRIQIPKLEFFVAYNGVERFQPETMLDLGALKIYFHMLDIRYDQLIEKSLGNALAGYSYFVKCIEENKETMSDHEAIDVAMKQTSTKGYLVEILNREECRNMLIELFSREAELEDIGMQKGWKNCALATAQAMLRKNLPLDMITEITGLTQEQIMTE